MSSIPFPFPIPVGDRDFSSLWGGAPMGAEIPCPIASLILVIPFTNAIAASYGRNHIPKKGYH